MVDPRERPVALFSGKGEDPRGGRKTRDQLCRGGRGGERNYVVSLSPAGRAVRIGSIGIQNQLCKGGQGLGKKLVNIPPNLSQREGEGED